MGADIALERLLENNRRWAAGRRERDPDFFARLSRQQRPRYLWIGCSDSRVPANEIVGLEPGEVFVHRNVGNIVAHTDLNCLSAVQYAVEVLGVEHVIVTGHYGCGAVQAAMEGLSLGMVDSWIRTIRDTYLNFEVELEPLDDSARLDRLCELNVAAQVANLVHSPIVQGAWARGRRLAVHGWIYRLRDGLIRDLELTCASPDGVAPIHRIDRPSK